MSVLQIYYQQQLKVLESQINVLSRFIVSECPEYPKGNMGAIEGAIQIINEERALNQELVKMITETEEKYQHKFIKNG
jgi:hypothetical protein